jgi:hypothetical protein
MTPDPEDLRGVPLGLLCRAKDVARQLNISEETWVMWKRAGLPVITASTRSELIFTDDLFEWLKTKPKLGKRPSAIRKQRCLARRERTKQ